MPTRTMTSSPWDRTSALLHWRSTKLDYLAATHLAVRAETLSCSVRTRSPMTSYWKYKFPAEDNRVSELHDAQSTLSPYSLSSLKPPYICYRYVYYSTVFCSCMKCLCHRKYYISAQTGHSLWAEPLESSPHRTVQGPDLGSVASSS